MRELSPRLWSPFTLAGVSDEILRLWTPRVGGASAGLRRRARAAAVAAAVWSTAGTLALVVAVVLPFTPPGRDPLFPFVGLVAVVATAAVLMLCVGVTLSGRARRLRYAALDEAYASVIRRTDAIIAAEALRRALVAPEHFDAWAREIALAPIDPDLAARDLGELLRLRRRGRPPRQWSSRIGPSRAAELQTVRRMRIVGVVLWIVGVCAFFSTIFIGAATVGSRAPLIVTGLTVSAVVAACGFTTMIAARRRRRVLAIWFAAHLTAAGLPTSPALASVMLTDSDAFDVWVIRRRRAQQEEAERPGDGREGDRREPGSAPQSPWRPGAPRPMLPGASARQWHGAGVLCLAVVGATWAVMCLVIASAPSRLEPGFTVVEIDGFVFGAVFLALAAICGLASIARTRREFVVGYTTLVQLSPWRDLRTAVDLVDDRSGRVLRAAGAPPLTRVMFDERRRRARDLS